MFESYVYCKVLFQGFWWNDESHNKGWKHSWKNFPPILGFQPGLPALKSNSLTTDMKSQLADAVVRDWIYTVDSRYLEFQGTYWNIRDIRTSTYQSWESEENNKSNNPI